MDSGNSVQPTFLPILLTGGIGDVVMAVDQVRALNKLYKSLVYTKHIEAFQYFCRDVPSAKLMPEYIWHLELNTVARFHKTPVFRDFLLDEHRNLFNRQLSLLSKDSYLQELVLSHPNKDCLLSQYARKKGVDRRNFPLYSLGLPSEPFCAEVRQSPDKIITVHDGYDTQLKSLVQGRSTKTWSLDSWRELVVRLKTAYPDYKVVQLGSSLSARLIEGIDESLVDKTTVTQAFDVLKKSSLHIDGDSGLVHAATRLGVPCVVIFGPTPDYFYGYSQNANLRSKVCAEACFWTKKDWMGRCPIGYSGPKCMDETRVEEVFQKVTEFLGK